MAKKIEEIIDIFWKMDKELKDIYDVDKDEEMQQFLFENLEELVKANIEDNIFYLEFVFGEFKINEEKQRLYLELASERKAKALAKIWRKIFREQRLKNKENKENKEN